MRKIVRAREQLEMMASLSRIAYDVQSPAPDLAQPLRTKRGPRVDSPDPVNDPMGNLTKRPYNYATMVDNLVSHYHGANDNEKKQGRLWYRAAHDMFHKFAKNNDVSPERAVAMGAAFSPLTDWGDNVHHAEKFMLGYRPGDPGDPGFNPHDWQTAHVDPKALGAYRDQYGRDPSDSDEDLHALADLHGDAFKRGPKSTALNDLSNPDARANWMQNIQHHGMDHILADSAAQAQANKKKKDWRPSMAMRPSGINTLGSNLQKAKDLHDAPEDIAQMFKVLGGPKISHFTDNILDDTPINSEGYYEHPNGDWMQSKDLGGTIDSHHVRAVSMPHGGWERKGYASKNPSSDHEYDVFNRGLFEATKRINDAQHDATKHITPKQLQAIVWLKHKNDKDFFERQKNPVTGKPIMHESELGGEAPGREGWQYAPKSYKSQPRAAALDENDFADMPPLWRKMFMSRQPQEWTDLLSAWVDHHSPDLDPALTDDREIQAALAYVDQLLHTSGKKPWPGYRDWKGPPKMDFSTDDGSGRMSDEDIFENANPKVLYHLLRNDAGFAERYRKYQQTAYPAPDDYHIDDDLPGPINHTLAFVDKILARHAALQQRPSRPGEAPPDYRDLWERPTGLSHDFDPFDDLDPHEEGRYAARTAERAEDFEWERSFDGGGGWELITHTPDGNPVTVDTEPTEGQRSQGRNSYKRSGR